MIDGTIHRINQRLNAEQTEFYRGDKRYHYSRCSWSNRVTCHRVNARACLLKYIIQSSYLALNATWLVICRFPGHMNDAHCYRTLPRIGRGMARDLPRRARPFSDGGYAARVQPRSQGSLLPALAP